MECVENKLSETMIRKRKKITGPHRTACSGFKPEQTIVMGGMDQKKAYIYLEIAICRDFTQVFFNSRKTTFGIPVGKSTRENSG